MVRDGLSLLARLSSYASMTLATLEYTVTKVLCLLEILLALECSRILRSWCCPVTTGNLTPSRVGSRVAVIAGSEEVGYPKAQAFTAEP
jgi:hypothetical protein